jgi:Flp pilus assembly pilin Flp
MYLLALIIAAIVLIPVALFWIQQTKPRPTASGKRVNSNGYQTVRRNTEMNFKPSRTKNSKKGVTIVEYAIMLALIAIAIALAAPNVTSAVMGVFNKASSVMDK